jgi:hypothetical protein
MGETPRPGQNFTYVIQFNPNATEMLPIELVEVTVDTQ